MIQMPSEDVLRWAADAVGGGAEIVAVEGLHDGSSPWRLRVQHDGAAHEVILRVAGWIPGAGIATGATALRVAEEHGLPAPHLLAAELDGQLTGVSATLETLVPGSTTWQPPTSAERLATAGAALAAVHAVAMAPREHLPFRPRPIAVDDFAADRRNGRMPTTPLLQEADDLIMSHGLPPGEPVYVHGDVHPGNLVWTDSNTAVLIDWKTAGVGAPGVDLGELRKQVAIRFGSLAPGHVLDGWERATGTSARDVAYWDAVAALNTPTESWGGTTTARDAFLRAALADLKR